MKLAMICTKREEDVNGFVYHFGVKTISKDFNVQRIGGDLHIRTIDPSHFKVGMEYTIHISELLTVSVGEMKGLKLN
jgi:hypothetical protein